MEEIKFNSDVFNLPDCPKDISIAVIDRSGNLFYGRFLSATPGNDGCCWYGRKQKNKLGLSSWVCSRFPVKKECSVNWPDGCIIQKPENQE